MCPEIIATFYPGPRPETLTAEKLTALGRPYAPVAGDDEHEQAERDEPEQVRPEGLGGDGREGAA
jgi:hypothetical protein